jgi:tetratricopeptide (TPR) repeat protein
MTSSTQTQDGNWGWLRDLWERGCLKGLLLVAAIIFAYQPVWHAGFIWDDDVHLTENSCIVGPLGFKGIWTSSAAVYYPLVLTSFWVQHALWGLNPLPYHLVNVAMHAACAILLWRVLQRLNVRGAWLGAALWGLHPVQAESVAWITELKNTQSCLFYLLAVHFFLKWRNAGAFTGRKGSEWHYALVLLCAVLAILSKASTVMLPVVIGLCWWWREGRWQWRNSLRLAPIFLISVVASLWTIWEQSFHSGAMGPEWAQTWPERFVIAGKVAWFYLGKLLWPQPLIFIYPRWPVAVPGIIAYLPVLAVAAGLFGLWLNRRRTRPVFFAFAYFVVSLFPVLDFFKVYFFRYSFVGDHFQYLASLGPLALAAAGISMALGRFEKRSLLLKPVFCGVLLLVLGVLTWRQSGMYVNAETLWRTTIARNPGCSMAYNNLGLLLQQRGQVDEAFGYFRKAVEIPPDNEEALDNLGLALFRKGQADEAIGYFRKAVGIQPDNEKALNNLGLALLQKGQVDEAMIHLQKAVEIQPNGKEAQNNLGSALLQKGQWDEAFAHFQKALEIQPDFAEAYDNLGLLLQQRGQVDEAIGYFRKAVEIQPDNEKALNNLGSALLQKGQWDEAFVHFQKALEIQPDFAEACYNLGFLSLRKGQSDKAIVYFQKGLKLQPNNVEAHKYLAWILAACPDASVRNGAQAVGLAQQAEQLSGGKDPAIITILAAAYAEAGRFPDALTTAQKALALATAQTNTAVVNALRVQIKCYQAGSPFRDRSLTNTPSITP